jgi:hypothetical protein
MAFDTVALRNCRLSLENEKESQPHDRYRIIVEYLHDGNLLVEWVSVNSLLSSGNKRQFSVVEWKQATSQAPQNG